LREASLSWSEPLFLNGLAVSRDPDEKAAIVDDFYRRHEARVAASPAGHGMDYVHIYLVIRKEGDS
jgi:indole-3-acetate O-methyltransferase